MTQRQKIGLQKDPPLQAPQQEVPNGDINMIDNPNTTTATISHEGVVLLGIPVGTKQFINNYVQQALTDKIKAFKRLNELPTQIAFHMLRLVIAPTPVFLVRALGDSYEYFKEWDKKVEREVFQLANQEHDYMEFKGRKEMDEDREKLLDEHYKRKHRCRNLTWHRREYFLMAESLIHLSSREGGLGIMMTSGIAMDAFLASSLNSIAMLRNRNVAFLLSETTKQIILKHTEKLEKTEVKNLLLPNQDSVPFDKITPKETQGLQRQLSTNTQKTLKSQIEANLRKPATQKLIPLFEDHQGDHANRVLTKPPTMTKTFQIEDKVMQEIISQTLLLPNDLGALQCHAKTGDTHNKFYANHINACSYTGGTQEKHTHAKRALEKILTMHDLAISNEKILSTSGVEYRADISIENEQRALIDVTCVQTSQNSPTLDIAMEDAYNDKVKKYNEMKNNCELNPDYKEDIKLIPVVIGPRGQFYKKSWRSLTEYLGIRDPKATQLEAKGINPLFRNRTDPEMTSLTISLLKALAFRVAVDTAVNARTWQELYKRYWNHHVESVAASRVTIERPNRH